MRHRIVGGRVLLPDGELAETDLLLEDGAIAGIGGPGGAAREWNVGGRLVLPGLVDIHGDAFERQIMPRPGVSVPLDVALVDTDRQLAAGGITTAFHGITCSWEPGLRSLATMHALLAALDRMRPRLLADHRVHLRFEAYNVDAVDEAIAAIGEGRVHLLAFNDHTPEIAERLDRVASVSKYGERSGLSADAFRDLVARALERRPEIAAGTERLAAAARGARVPMAAHDERTPEQRRRYRALGAAVCEFPQNRDTAEEARRGGDAIVMGAPNVLRGGSHLGAAGAEELLRDGLCDVLASDYHYPALLLAPFRLAERGACSFGAAWRLVSANAAAAAGLADRGEIALGRRADIILVDDRDPGPPTVRAGFIAGRPAYAAGFIT